MQIKKQKLVVFAIAFFSVFAVTSTIYANYRWKDYFSFGEMKAFKNETLDSVLHRLEKDPEWKEAIGGRNIKDGTITAEKLAPGVFAGGASGTFALNGGIITDSSGTVSIGRKGYDQINLFGNTTVDGGLTVNRGLFAKYNISMDSVAAGQQVYLTDKNNKVQIGDNSDDTLYLYGDTQVQGDAVVFGSVAANGNLYGENLTINSTSSVQHYITDAENKLQLGDDNDTVDVSNADYVKMPAATIGGACTVSGAIGTNPAGNAGERILVCNGTTWIAN